MTSAAYRAILLFLVVLMTALAPGLARAQPTPGSTGELELAVDSVGVGNLVRPGSWAAVRARFRNLTNEPALEVILRLEARDADGDWAMWERTVAADQGRWEGAWIYFRAPFAMSGGDLVKLSAYEAIESEASPTGWRAGRLLAQQIAGAGMVETPAVSLIGLLGNRRLGLNQYAEQRARNDPRASWLLSGHGATQIVSLEPASVPDRWLGLESLEALIWKEGNPGELSLEQAGAIREWVASGGHLVVVLPPAGQEWLNPVNNELYGLLPVMQVTRLEGTSTEPYRWLLTDDEDREVPPYLTVHTFEAMADAAPDEAICALEGADGTCVVARRIYGLGMVTVVGIDLRSRGLLRYGLPDASVFWHRVLGKRGRFIEDDQRATFNSTRPMQWNDGVIAQEIDKSQRSAAGLLLAVVVFALYWLLAGPVGFGILKMRGATRHAWVGFLLAGAAFTAVAWTGATAIRPKRVEATHLSFMTQVYGQDVQRALTWTSLLIPEYGSATLRTTSEEAGPNSPVRRFHSAIAPWEPRDTALGLAASFPDARGYRIDARSPNELTFPARQTVKQFRVDWVGPPRWMMPRPVLDEEGEAEIRWHPDGEKWRLSGSIVHELPDGLEDARLLVNPGQKGVTTAEGEPLNLGDQLLADAGWFAIKPGDVWDPGEPLDLAAATDRSESTNIATYSANKQLQDLVGERSMRRGFTDPEGERKAPDEVTERLVGLLMYDHLQPPRPDINAMKAVPAVLRSEAHGVNLSKWLTQPSVIVIGHLQADGRGTCPAPLYVGESEEETYATGRTVIAWVYPMPEAPPEYVGSDASEATVEDPSGP